MFPGCRDRPPKTLDFAIIKKIIKKGVIPYNPLRQVMRDERRALEIRLSETLKLHVFPAFVRLKIALEYGILYFVMSDRKFVLTTNGCSQIKSARLIKIQNLNNFAFVENLIN